MNSRKNIWINKSNLPRFDQEQNKSGLINTLLEKHYTPSKSLMPAHAVVIKEVTTPALFAARKPLPKGKAK